MEGIYLKTTKKTSSSKKSLKITKEYIEGQTIQWPKEKGQTMIHNTLHRKRKIAELYSH